MRIRCSGVDRRDMTTAAVAAASEASTKKCQGWKPRAASRWASAASGSSRTFSIEVAELIVEPRPQVGIVAGIVAGGCAGCVLPARPAEGRDRDAGGARGSDQVRKKPREAVEPLVDRRGENGLVSVLFDEGRDHG